MLPAGTVAAQSETVKAAMQPFVDNGEVAGLVTFVGNKQRVGLPNSDGSAMRKALHAAAAALVK